MSAGKGDTMRPTDIKTYRDNYDRIFRKPPSYAASQGAKPFDWAAFLRKDGYTLAELFTAEARAKGWTTCACGSLCDRLPRDAEGAPEDNLLASLGQSFSAHISRLRRHWPEGGDYWKKDRDDAFNRLIAIEERSARLLEHLNNPTNS